MSVDFQIRISVPLKVRSRKLILVILRVSRKEYHAEVATRGAL